MSDEHPGWNEKNLEEAKQWAIEMVIALNACLIQADIEPIDIRLEE